MADPPPPSARRPAASFVTVSGGRLQIDGAPAFFCGANAPHLLTYAADEALRPRVRGRWRYRWRAVPAFTAGASVGDDGWVHTRSYTHTVTHTHAPSHTHVQGLCAAGHAGRLGDEPASRVCVLRRRGRVERAAAGAGCGGCAAAFKLWLHTHTQAARQQHRHRDAGRRPRSRRTQIQTRTHARTHRFRQASSTSACLPASTSCCTRRRSAACG